MAASNYYHQAGAKILEKRLSSGSGKLYNVLLIAAIAAIAYWLIKPDPSDYTRQSYREYEGGNLPPDFTPVPSQRNQSNNEQTQQNQSPQNQNQAEGSLPPGFTPVPSQRR